MGRTQYIDAFQRANFWGTVSSHPNSHLLLSPTVLAEQTLSPSRTYGTTGNPFGFTAALVDINWFDSQVPALISKFGIQPNQFPIFLLYDTYLTQGGSCCIGGYHSSEGSVSNPQAYAEATYVDHVGAFSQDVSALSHEIGEWADDPLTVNFNGNNTPCGILEVGDPEEGDANFGAFPYVLHNFTYNLQELAFFSWFFGAPSKGIHGWFSNNATFLTDAGPRMAVPSKSSGAAIVKGAGEGRSSMAFIYRRSSALLPDSQCNIFNRGGMILHLGGLLASPPGEGGPGPLFSRCNG